MAYNIGIIIFIVLIVIVILGLIVFVFYMNAWLCFSKAPRCHCFEEDYEELKSIVDSEEDEEDAPAVSEVQKTKEVIDDKDYQDDQTIAASEIGQNMEGFDADEDLDLDEARMNCFGKIIATIQYTNSSNTVSVLIQSVQYIPDKKIGGASEYLISIAIFDDENNKLSKTWHTKRFVSVNNASHKNTKFLKFEHMDLSEKNLNKTAIRFRLYGCERKHRDILLGEAILGLANIRTIIKNNPVSIFLEKRASLKHGKAAETIVNEPGHHTEDVKVDVVDAGESTPELQIGLGYNPVTGRLTIEVVKGNSFKNPIPKDEEKLPSSFVKITISAANNQEIDFSKTTIRRNQANPLFREKFMFHVPQFQLPEVTVMFGVYHRKSVSRKDLIGWFSIGLNNSSDREKEHWRLMIEGNGKLIYLPHDLNANTVSRSGVPGAK